MPTHVQTKTNYAGTTNASLVMDATPADKNLLVAGYHSNTAQGDAAAGSGWVALGTQITDGSGGGVWVAWKVCGAGESTTQTPFTWASSPNRAMTVSEFSPDAGFAWDPSPAEAFAGNTDADATKTTTGTCDPTDGVTRLLVGFGFSDGARTFSAEKFNGSTTGVAEHGDINGGTATAGETCCVFSKVETTSAGNYTAEAVASAIDDGAAFIAIFKQVALSTTAFKDTNLRARFRAPKWADTAVRAVIRALKWSDVSLRARIRAPGFKDTPLRAAVKALKWSDTNVRAKFNARAFSDTLLRTHFRAPGFRDTPLRAVIIALRYADIGTRARFRAPGYRDTNARAEIRAPQWRDVSTMVRIIAPGAAASFSDVMLRAVIRALRYKDIGIRSAFSIRAYRDTSLRSRFRAPGYRDTNTLTKIFARVWSDVGLRARFNIRGFKDTNLRSRFRAPRWSDTAARAQLQAITYRNTDLRSRFDAPGFRDIGCRAHITTPLGIVGETGQGNATTVHVKNQDQHYVVVVEIPHPSHITKR